MASYSEVKKFIYKFFGVSDSVSEDSSIAIKINSNIIGLENKAFKNLFNNVSSWYNTGLELYYDNSRECAIQNLYVYFDGHGNSIKSEDEINKICYLFDNPSYEYCVYILIKIVDYINSTNYDVVDKVRAPVHRSLCPAFPYDGEFDDPLALLNHLFRFRTIQVNSIIPKNHTELKNYSIAFEFELMYKYSNYFFESQSIVDLFHLNDSDNLTSSTEDEIVSPKRIYNTKVISYYSMALESFDPFTKYISFYHVIEHYFDAVFRKKLTIQIKEKITHPGFSYKDEEQLYELAKHIRKHMSDDEKSGKGNEFESLKYVLNEYVDIDELKTRINSLSSDSVNYYQNNSVPFVTKKSTQISWADLSSVFTTLANRIYLTRNALVHSKSEMEDNLYKPYEHRQELIKEIPLIRAVAEQVIINSSEDI